MMPSGAHQSSNFCSEEKPLSIRGFIIAGNAASDAAITTIAIKAMMRTPQYFRE
jgi:hypothetical protein